ncbi:hypothetical protein, partial [Francisella sp. 19X1-34]|uniref:hypothetical protein n=1 Tax=Francisella sp. 19X1-34 TaxID=3087177 RepID=UPI002E36CB7D
AFQLLNNNGLAIFNLIYIFCAQNLIDYTNNIKKFSNIEFLNIIGVEDPEHHYEQGLELSACFSNTTTKIYPCGAPCYGYFPYEVFNDINLFLNR